jgi:uncharacterized protein involved in exopolysaccharide biosynthesis
MENDSVEFIDYLRVFWKQKVLIVTGIILFMVAAGTVSFILPPKYKVYAVQEIGTVNIVDEIVPIENPIDTKTKIERAYRYKVMEELEIPEEEFPELTIDNPKGTRIIELSTESEDIDKSLTILKKINTLLLDDHNKLVEEKKTILRNDIQTLVLKVVTVKGEKKGLLEKLALLKENRKNVQEQIKKVEKRLDELLTEKKKLNLSANPDNTLSMLVFTSEIQENQRYYNRLQDKLKFDIANSEVDIRNVLAGKEEMLETLGLKKQNLEARLKNLKETTIIKEPGYLKNPVKPRKILNILIAGAVGLMVTLFMAFFMEYLEGVRKREQDTSV